MSVSQRHSARHGTPRSFQPSFSPPNMVKPTATFGVLGRSELGDGKKWSCHPPKQLRESEKAAGRAGSLQTLTHCTEQSLPDTAAPAQ